MTFEEILDQAIAMLQRRGRLTYGALKRQFQLDDAYLEDVKAELIEGQRLAVDEEGRVLVWIGAEVSAPDPTAPPVRSQDRLPLAYTPPYLAEKILTSKSTLEGERKQVTVLFADLKGSMELLADRDPEEARQLLDPVLERMMAAVHRYEGTVNQVMGDGIMALFGAPIAHEDHTVRACYAALAMQGAIRTYAEEVRRTHGVTVQIRVGLNSGEVVVRAIGNDLHMDYTAVGQTTHVAARMEQLAQPGSTLLTAETLRLVEGLVRVTALGPIPVKGLDAPVEVFELVSASALRGRFPARVAGGLTRFVGRDTELAALHQLLERAGAGHGQIVAAVGEAGVGKSRLVYEFVHSHHTRGWRVLESASVSYGKATPYFPVVDLLKRYVHVEEGDDPRTIRAKVTGQILTLDESLQETLPALLSLLDALPEDSPFLALDPPQRRQRTLDGLKRILVRESQVQPLLLVFEDLHWIDSETQALLDSLIDSLPTARLLLLVNYRPEYQHGWGSKTYYTQLRLDPLSPASAEAVLDTLLGQDPSLVPLKQLLIARTEGNPFFLEESVRTLVETGVLVGEPGAYRLAQALPTIQVPATVQAVLAARIDRLPPEEKRLLQTAAVIGTEVPLPLLQAIAELPEAALHRGLAHLQAAEFLYETRLFPEQDYTFKHALTHEVAYGSLLLERRRVLHARIVEALEALAGAGGRAGRTPGAPCPAGRGVGQGRDLLPAGRRQGLRPRRVPRGGGRLRAGPPGPRAPARGRRHQGAGHRSPPRYWDARCTHWESMGGTSPCWARPRPWPGRSTIGPGWDGCWPGWPGYAGSRETPTAPSRRASRPSISRPRSATAPCRRKHPIAWGRHTMPSATSAGRPSCCGETCEAADRESGTPSTDVRIESRAWLAQTLSALGAFAEGRRHGEEALRLATLAGRGDTPIIAHRHLGHLYLTQGDLEHAIRVLEQGLALCRASGNRDSLRTIAAGLGYASALQGRLAEGRALLEEAISESIRTGALIGLARWVAWLSEVCRLAGRGDEAWQHARQALDLARQQKARGERGTRAASAWRRPCPRRPSRCRRRLKPTTSRPWPWPRNSACARSWPTATSGLGTAVLPDRPAGAGPRRPVHRHRAVPRHGMTFWLPQAEAALAQVEEQ